MLLLAMLLQAAVPAAPRQSSQPSPQAMVDALHTAFGEHHARAAHAKGILAEGIFTPAPEAASLSRAIVFREEAMPALVRFSNFTGIPDIADNIAQANPRGLAVKITLPGGKSADFVTHSANGFPTATSEEFRQFLTAAGQSGAGAPKPTPIEQFLSRHPETQAFLAGLKPLPQGYGTLTYFGVNAFKFTDARGGSRYIRYRFVPRDGEKLLTPEEIAKRDQNYLQSELPARLAKGPIVYTWYAQIAEAGDAIDNPNVAWPDSRTMVKLGTLTITRMVADQATADRTSLFIPTNVPDGIEPADPMLLVRQGAYPISFSHRQ